MIAPQLWKTSPTSKQLQNPNEDNIEEDIVLEQSEEQPTSARDALVTSGAMSSVVGVDQSIESLNLNEFDYVEEVKNSEYS